MSTAGTEPRLTASVKTREVLLSDYPQISALNARNGLEAKPREEWEHLWVNNPVYKKVSGWPMGWVAENDGQVVGYFGNIPVSYQFKGREVVGASLYSTSLDAPFRGYAILLIKRFLKWSRAVEYNVCTTANASSSKLIEATKAPHVPVGDWGNSSFWITNHQGFIAGALGKKRLPGVLAYPAAMVLSLRDRIFKPGLPSPDSGNLISCSGFDERFEGFWQDLQRTYPNRLLATRSREVLEWHFKNALAQNKVWIVTQQEKSRILAYAIFYRYDNPEINLKRIRLIDFQNLSSDNSVLVSMLSWGLRKCREEGIHMLEAYGFRPDKQQVIDKLAPYRRKLPSWFYFYKALNKTLYDELQNPDVWDPSHFDGDASL